MSFFGSKSDEEYLVRLDALDVALNLVASQGVKITNKGFVDTAFAIENYLKSGLSPSEISDATKKVIEYKTH